MAKTNLVLFPIGLFCLMAFGSCTATRTQWDFQAKEDLADWTIHGTSAFDETIFSTLEVNTEGTGTLQSVVTTGSWYGSMTGGLVSRLQDGGFVATARLFVHGAQGPLPQGTFELAGLMLRKPLTDEGHDAANWEYIVTGGSGGSRMIDYKTTRDSVSTFRASAAVGPWIELRLARRGTQIIKLWREDGGPWQWVETQDRPDLAGAMQLGLCFLSNWEGESDLRADIDWVRIDPLPASSSSLEELIGELKK